MLETIGITWLIIGLFLSTLKTGQNLYQAGEIHIYMLKRELGDWLLGVLLWPVLFFV